MRMIEKRENENDAEVTWEDQQRINTFSKLNGRVRRLEESLETLKQEKESLDDLSTELELTDEEERVSYRVGESFVMLPRAKAMGRLDKEQASVEKEMESLSTRISESQSEMMTLKTELYSKFGNAINLDE